MIPANSNTPLAEVIEHVERAYRQRTLIAAALLIPTILGLGICIGRVSAGIPI